MLAPVGVSIYKRLSHLQKTIQSLAANRLAAQTDLFLFSDAPGPGDEAEVSEVRKYLREVRGFKSISIIERETNSRIFNNRQGHKFLLERYGKMIWLEEDIVTSPHFLTFMNEALDVYENDQTVFSVCGYSPPIRIPADYQRTAYRLMRFNAWGFGIWKDRYDHIDYVSRVDYLRLALNPIQRARFSRGGGEDMIRMLCLDVLGGIDALDVKAMYCQFVQGQTTIYPVGSLAKNIGFDGTGRHCNATNKFDVHLDSEGTCSTWDERTSLCNEIAMNNYRFRKMTMYEKAVYAYKSLKLLSKK